MRSADLADFIREREAVRKAKEMGAPRSIWTKDPILGKYRFCNVHREDDRVTKWLRENWYCDELRGFKQDPDAWFAAVVARLLNLPESLEAVRKYITPFKPEKFMRELQQRALRGEKNFNAAYIVSTNGKPMNKAEYITYCVLNIMWGDRKRLRPSSKDTLETYHSLLMGYDGMGSFIAAQVVGDLKYMEPLKSASDWWTFAASGPGSRRGLNRVAGRRIDSPWRESEWRSCLRDLQGSKDIAAFKLHAQDLQNCLCEFDKYERARLGEGTPKQIYKERA